MYLVCRLLLEDCAHLTALPSFPTRRSSDLVKSSQKRSISRRSSSWGMDLMNFLAAARVTESYLVICAAVERAMRNASPSPASCATRPTACEIGRAHV